MDRKTADMRATSPSGAGRRTPRPPRGCMPPPRRAHRGSHPGHAPAKTWHPPWLQGRRPTRRQLLPLLAVAPAAARRPSPSPRASPPRAAALGGSGPRMPNRAGWHVTQLGFAESTCESWLKVTTPGLSAALRELQRRREARQVGGEHGAPRGAAATRIEASFVQVVMRLPLRSGRSCERGLVPVVAGQRPGDAVDGRAAVLQHGPSSGRIRSASRSAASSMKRRAGPSARSWRRFAARRGAFTLNSQPAPYGSSSPSAPRAPPR